MNPIFAGVTEALAGLAASHDLPELPPDDPMPILLSWLAEADASKKYNDPNAMTLATSTPDGTPSARIVLCKAIEIEPPAIVFYTSYEGRKAREIESNPRVACLFHWPHAGRQARIEGAAERTTTDESDAYFASRSLLSRVGAVASRQSTPLESRAELLRRAVGIAREAAAAGRLDRPQSWGGYRISISAVELWSAGQGRLHDRFFWTRDTRAASPGWHAQRLSP
ncbi:MAG: pyridoxamine 5'-phosphate oxidase [Phycisphaerales bacterium]|nr:pyridoxamine 5'-phosphate oxidase [Phycisphaerales bacterium]